MKTSGAAARGRSTRPDPPSVTGASWVRAVSSQAGAAVETKLQFRRLTSEGDELAHRPQLGLDLVEVYVQGREHEELYQLAEALVEWDERITMWRIRHYKVVARIIGDQVVGTQGTPVEVLGKMIHHNFFPALWRARNQLTARAKEEGG